jgi:predicted aspartyl protease
MTMLSQQVAEEIGLDLSCPVRFQRIASVHQVTQAPVLRLTSLQVGSQRLTDVEVLVLSLPPDLRVDGLLGVNFLEYFRPTFEFDQATLVLR